MIVEGGGCIVEMQLIGQEGIDVQIGCMILQYFFVSFGYLINDQVIVCWIMEGMLVCDVIVEVCVVVVEGLMFFCE